MKPYRSYSFSISSGSEVRQLVSKMEATGGRKFLTHISAFEHNTVLTQTLRQELSQHFGGIQIIELLHEEKERVDIVLYTCSNIELTDSQQQLHELLSQVTQENRTLHKRLSNSKSELLARFYTDTLSNLPNLYKLRNDLEKSDNATFIVFNIDNFKIINDFYGFIVGDFIIERFAKAIVDTVKEETVYRIAGDEFAILTDRQLNFYELKEYLTELAASLSHLRFSYARTEIYIDVTMASSSGSLNDAFSKVNMALRYAKENKLAFWIYEDSMKLGDVYETNLKIATKIRKAIEHSGIVPYFQPIIDNNNGTIVKFEVLSRLIDPEGHIYAPQLFIPIAKKIKVYNLITKSIIEKSFEFFKDLPYHFSINLSIDDIMDQDIYNFIIHTLQKSGFANRVVLELLETEQINDYKKVSRFITEVRRYGTKIAIDDFGSGFSNFFYMTRLDPDYIKIDGSLIKEIDIDTNAQIVVETIVQFAKKMHIKTIAEYVHSSTVLSEVKLLGIDYSQGFYIDTPKPDISL